MLAVFAEFERDILRDRVKAGVVLVHPSALTWTD
jgi:DNA invertase Pin-like site-specific DNA recombinase